MFKFITNFVKARIDDHKDSELALKLMGKQLALATKMAEVQTIRAQNKCLSCKHEYEEKRETAIRSCFLGSELGIDDEKNINIIAARMNAK